MSKHEHEKRHDRHEKRHEDRHEKRHEHREERHGRDSGGMMPDRREPGGGLGVNSASTGAIGNPARKIPMAKGHGPE